MGDVLMCTGLGLVQGLTEFLPISSSGHLRLLGTVLAPPPGVSTLTLEILLHAGTLLATVVWLRRELVALARGGLFLAGRIVGRRAGWDPDERLFAFVVLASLPTAALGLAMKRWGVEHLGPQAVALGLFVTGLCNYTVRGRAEEGDHHVVEGLTWTSALAIGVVQGLAVLPGISRSGSTIAAGRALGLPVARAARVSFLLSVPAVGGATLLALRDLWQTPATQQAAALAPIAVGGVVAFVSGLAALSLLFRLVARDRFRWFAYYCWVVAAVVRVVGR